MTTWRYTTPKLLKSKLTGRVITVEKQIDGFYFGNTIHLHAILQYEVKGKKGNQRDHGTCLAYEN